MYQKAVTTRERFEALLTSDPGLHLREAPRQLGVSLRTARYHLEALVSEGRAVRQEAGGFVRYFPAGVYDSAERRAIGAVRVESQRLVIGALLREPAQTFTQLLSATGLARSTLASSLRRMEVAGVLARTEAGLWALGDPGRCRMAFALFRPRITDVLADSADSFFDALW